MTIERVEQMNRMFAKSDKMVAKKNVEYARYLNDCAQQIKDDLIAEGYVLAWDKNGMFSISAAPATEGVGR